ncbi:MBL fold metallo-hydrolase [Egicoccus halophilus]|uniref:Hydrolase n=1 Tax=Egicoccus halophilus TaxID=1670830 RepID=A0A8J3ABD0_9ACTN|nr:MBL fold metallo-hydrolase [Egicoccus halophilus]GGI07323.1 hydrolase [Egicoccus halophilus]
MTDRFILGVPLGRWQTNCWIVGDRGRGSAVVVDPGEHGAEQVPGLLERAGVRCEAILLTHGHLDHAWAVPELARSLETPVLLHADDRWLWDDPAAAFGAPPELLEQQFGLRWDPPDEYLRELRDGARLSFAGLRFDVRHNPGHTPGHVTYLGRELADTPVTFALGDAEVATEDVLFSGDLLFAGSIGRTDFPRGSTDDMWRSLTDTVLPLDDDTLVLCGHGTDTTVGHERATNPFLRQLPGVGSR